MPHMHMLDIFGGMTVIPWCVSYQPCQYYLRMELNFTLLSETLLLGPSSKVKKMLLSISITEKKIPETVIEKCYKSEIFKLLVSESLYMLRSYGGYPKAFAYMGYIYWYLLF